MRVTDGSSLGPIERHPPHNSANVFMSRAGTLVATPTSSLNGFIKGIGRRKCLGIDNLPNLPQNNFSGNNCGNIHSAVIVSVYCNMGKISRRLQLNWEST